MSRSISSVTLQVWNNYFLRKIAFKNVSKEKFIHNEPANTKYNLSLIKTAKNSYLNAKIHDNTEIYVISPKAHIFVNDNIAFALWIYFKIEILIEK